MFRNLSSLQICESMIPSEPDFRIVLGVQFNNRNFLAKFDALLWKILQYILFKVLLRGRFASSKINESQTEQGPGYKAGGPKLPIHYFPNSFSGVLQHAAERCHDGKL